MNTGLEKLEMGGSWKTRKVKIGVPIEIQSWAQFKDLHKRSVKTSVRGGILPKVKKDLGKQGTFGGGAVFWGEKKGRSSRGGD